MMCEGLCCPCETRRWVTVTLFLAPWEQTLCFFSRYQCHCVFNQSLQGRPWVVSNHLRLQTNLWPVQMSLICRINSQSGTARWKGTWMCNSDRCCSRALHPCQHCMGARFLRALPQGCIVPSFRFLQIWWVRDAIWLFWLAFFLLTKSSSILAYLFKRARVCVCVCVCRDLGSFSFGLFAFSPWFVGLLSKLEKWHIWNLRETKAIPRCHLYFLLSRYLAKGCREVFPFHDFWISCIINKTFPTLKFIKEFTHVLSETFIILHLGFILGIFWDISSSGSFSPSLLAQQLYQKIHFYSSIWRCCLCWICKYHTLSVICFSALFICKN